MFYYRDELREKLDIPVFHDDQHGTAIISTAGIINALDLTNKKIEDVKVVVNGAGAAGIAASNYLSLWDYLTRMLFYDLKVLSILVEMKILTNGRQHMQLTQMHDL